MNYNIDEAYNVGKGANSIISMLKHFLETHELAESHLQLHADNCLGQNKNRYMMIYLMWKALIGLNEEMTFPSFWSATQSLLQTRDLVYSRDCKVLTIYDTADVVCNSAADHDGQQFYQVLRMHQCS